MYGPLIVAVNYFQPVVFVTLGMSQDVSRSDVNVVIQMMEVVTVQIVDNLRILRTNKETF